LPPRFIAGLVLIAAAVLVLHVLPIGTGDRVWGELLSVAHVVGFALFALAAAAFCLRDGTGRRVVASIALAGAFATLVAVLSELAQIPTGRDADVTDLYRDAAGIAAGLSAAAAVVGAGRWRLALVGVALAGLAAGLWEPGGPLVARVAAQMRFPVLMDFDGPFEGALIERVSTRIEIVDAPAGWPVRGKVARVRPRGNWRYEGISFFGLPADWSEYETLEFIVAAEEPVRLALTVRVHDRAHNDQYSDRFNRVFAVGQEPVVIRIPLAEIRDAPAKRKLDLTQIEDVTIFLTSPFESGFYLDNLQLD
jgi:hypothetical protein